MPKKHPLQRVCFVEIFQNSQYKIIAKQIKRNLSSTCCLVLGREKHFHYDRCQVVAQCVDVLALNQTRLDDSISYQDILMQNYDLIRVDRSRTGGGVCLYLLKDSINYLERKDLLIDNLKKPRRNFRKEWD